MGIRWKLERQDIKVFDDLQKLDAQEESTSIWILDSTIRFIIWIFIIELSSESSPFQVLKIQDDYQEKGKNRAWKSDSKSMFSAFN